MKKIKIILQITLVLGIMFSAGVLLYQTEDIRLAAVEFVANESNTVTIPAETITEITDQPETTKKIPEISTDVTTESSEPAEPTKLDSAIAPTTTSASTTTERSTVREDITNRIATVVIYSPTETITCSAPLLSAATAHQVMRQASEQCQFTYQGKNYAGLGFFVEKLGAVASNKTAGQFWIYSVNGAKATLGVSQQIVQPGDTITWTYEADYNK